MASAKSRRYGQGGMKHKGTRQEGRPNGKSFKQYPKKFSEALRRLVTVHN
jgi:hypothetical protein